MFYHYVHCKISITQGINQWDLIGIRNLDTLGVYIWADKSLCNLFDVNIIGNLTILILF